MTFRQASRQVPQKKTKVAFVNPALRFYFNATKAKNQEYPEKIDGIVCIFEDN
jgi:hypothetical protein